MAKALACLDDPDRFVREAVLARLLALASVDPLDPLDPLDPRGG